MQSQEGVNHRVGIVIVAAYIAEGVDVGGGGSIPEAGERCVGRVERVQGSIGLANEGVRCDGIVSVIAGGLALVVDGERGSDRHEPWIRLRAVEVGKGSVGGANEGKRVAVLIDPNAGGDVRVIDGVRSSSNLQCELCGSGCRGRVIGDDNSAVGIADKGLDDGVGIVIEGADNLSAGVDIGDDGSVHRGRAALWRRTRAWRIEGYEIATGILRL